MTTRRNLLVICSILCVGVFLACSETSTNSAQPILSFRQSGCLEGTEVNYRAAHGPQEPYIVTVETRGCRDSLAGTYGDPAGPGGSVRFTVSADTVFVHHDSAFYNCCAKFAFQVERNHDTLDFIEADTASTGCYCLCYFDLRAAAAGVAPGNYTARLWSEDREYLLGLADIAVPGATTAWFETRCDTLLVYHSPRNANCGSIFIFEYEQIGQMLTFTEVDTSSAMLRCMCDFELAAQVTGLADGQYTVSLRDGGNAHGFNGVVDSLVTEAVVNISCP
jgi:hypothetical protein